ncbi:SCO family protein [Taibaiella koreensis]|uniref:SCO family protein n=1 Tax=Taibaiella koreensis TaxID=1268548 RepID=UPI000E5A09B9|nr:SCO family protein [Taibaiella koreensis]
MRLNKIIKYLIGITIAAAVPLLFFFVTPSGRLNIPAYYRPERIVSRMEKGKVVRDTFFHQVRDLTLTNQLGQKVSLNKDLKGKVLVIDFIFTTCPSVCPRLSANMKELQKAYIKKNPELVQFISISVDPERDSVPALREYANRYEADHDRWWFLTGNKDSIFNYAKNELGLLLENADVPGDFVHSQKMILIDTARNIRGYFDGLDKTQTKKIADDIYILNVEKRKHGR